MWGDGAAVNFLTYSLVGHFGNGMQLKACASCCAFFQLVLYLSIDLLDISS